MTVAGKLRRGFKTEANNWAKELREEMGVQLSSPLCPWRLAEHLCVPVLDASKIVDAKTARYLATEQGLREVSAMVCFEGIAAKVIVNDAHSRKRLASNVAHELAHVVLRHPPTDLFHEDGTRNFNSEYEDEANWLGPALLMSEQAALAAFSLISRGQVTLAAYSDEHQISEEVIQMRMNVVGARRRVRFAAE